MVYYLSVSMYVASLSVGWTAACSSRVKAMLLRDSSRPCAKYWRTHDRSLSLEKVGLTNALSVLLPMPLLLPDTTGVIERFRLEKGP